MYNATGISLVQNTLIGNKAGQLMRTGADYNTAVGSFAGASVTTGNNNIFIGYTAGYLNQKVDVKNSIAIGSGSYTTANNTVQLGNAAITNVASHGDFEAQDIGDGFICKSPNGTRYRITVNDDGAVVAAVA